MGPWRSLRAWWTRAVGTRRPGACAACGEEARFGGRVCKACLKSARRVAREESGEGLRGARGRYRTLQGFIVQSEGEVAIADHLFRNGVLFQYEPHVGDFRPDFLVPASGVIVEYYGMKSKDYNERRHRKEAAYASRGYRVIAIRRQDLSRLGEILKELGEPPPGLRNELKRQRDAHWSQRANGLSRR